MKPVLQKFLSCPNCGSSLDLKVIKQKGVELTPEEIAVITSAGRGTVEEYSVEIVTGTLQCASCNALFPIHDGVPRLYREAEKDFPIEGVALNTQMLPLNKHEREVQTSFSDEWDEFNYEDGTIWLWSVDERLDTFCEEVGINSPSELSGKLMIECGCGPAVMSLALSSRYCVEIIAMDMAYMVGKAHKVNKSNLLHFIQTSLLNPPLKDKIADLTHSHGVLHHTYNTKKAFDGVERLTKPGGMLYVWLYGRKKGWNRFRFGFIRSARFIIARLPRIPQTGAVWTMAGVTAVIRFFKRLAGLEKVRYTSVPQFIIGIRDKYTPLYAREHTESEVLQWFKEAGYVNAKRRTNWEKTKMWRGSTDLSIRGIKQDAK